MSELDVNITLWLNQYSQMNQVFDSLVVVVNRYHLLRGVVIVALLWWAWMGSRTRLVTDDLFMVRTVLGVFVAIAVARGLQNFLPDCPRPAHDPTLNFRVPLGFSGADALKDWSSFPSDHAVLIAAIVVAVLLLNRLIGVLALVWAVCVILLPRVYLGLHYASDIVGGAVLGAAVMVAAQRFTAPQELAPALMRLEDQYRALAYGGLFVFSYLCATMFSDVRELLRVLGEFATIIFP